MFSYHASNKVTAEKDIEEFEKDYETRKAAETEKKEPEMDEETFESGQHKKVILEPFAKISEVQKGSPADECGFQIGDLLMIYGTLNYLNHNQLKSISEVTKNNIDQKFQAVVKRDGKTIELSVRPHNWNGPGILGCRFVAL